MIFPIHRSFDFSLLNQTWNEFAMVGFNDHRLGEWIDVVAPDEPYRVSSTPYWVRKHAGIPPEVFARRSVRSQANCQACHRDAESGRFDDQAIAIPEEERP